MLTSVRSLRLRFEMLEDRAVPATLFVDDDRLQIPQAAYRTIQSAIDAAAVGDTIVVAPGFYREQVTFNADKDGITLRARNPLLAVIQAPSTLTGEPAVVTVAGADNVTVRGFTITGGSAAGTGPLAGVSVRDGGSATIRNNTIAGIRNRPLDGLQTGLGVLVLGANDGTAAVIRDNTIADYQKGGVVVFGDGASADVTGNTIVGAGPTGLIAQNGVQVSDGASAFVADNVITGNVYTGTDAVATGVLVDSTDEVTLSANRVFGNQVGLAVFNSGGVIVSANRVSENTADGVQLAGVSGGQVVGNRVEDNGTDGVVLDDSTGLIVTDNTVRRNGGDGLVLTNGSAGNVVFFNDLRQNDGFDAFDDTTGSLTGGTANLWFLNRIGTKNVPGLR